MKITHVGKCHRAYMRIPLIDKIAPPPPPPPQAATFCIRFHSFVTYLLTSVTIKSQFSHQANLTFKCQFFTCVRIGYKFFTHVGFDINFSQVIICYQFFTDLRFWYRFFTRLRFWYRLFTFVKIKYHEILHI